MDEPRFEELRNRITTLEREKRRWKVIGVTSLVVLTIVLFLGCAGYIGTGVFLVRYQRLREETRAVEREREEERRAAEQAREEAERAKRQAEEKAREDGK